jgi:GGDEF domain-containing protein
MFETIRQKFLNGLWFWALTSFSLLGISYFFHPVDQWLKIGIVEFFSLLFVMFLLFFWSKTQAILAVVAMLCATMLGFSGLLQHPEFIAMVQVDGVSKVLFAIAPCFILSMLLSWRGYVLGLVMTMVFIAPHDTVWHFFFGMMGIVIVTSIGVLFHYTLVRLQKAYAQLEEMAVTDPLTKLGNRTAMRNDYATKHEFSVLTLWDLNGLKQINDQQGHEAGDGYILEFARCLRESIPHPENIYRVGGDEFVGFHNSSLPPDALISQVHKRFPDVAVGWVQFEGQSLDIALHDADVLMYKHKRTMGGERRREMVEGLN